MKKPLILLMVLLAVSTQYALAQEDRLAVLHTESGDLVIEFFSDDAPNHTDNFIRLVEEGFYDQTIFHRVINDFMIQGGDPLTRPGEYESTSEWGTGDPGYLVDAEFNNIEHDRGIVSMARSADPNSAGSQFFVVHADSNFLDQRYTVFGRLVTQQSYETLDTIAGLETPEAGTIPLNWGQAKITSAEIVERGSVDDLLELGEPERIALPDSAIEEGPYINEELGIKFDVPEGWVLQEPDEGEGTPDLVMVGPSIRGYNPAVSITVDPRDGADLEFKINDSNSSLQAAIDSGQLEITSEERLFIGGVEAYQKSAVGVFVLEGNPTGIMFREVILADTEEFYTATYTAEESIFEESLVVFEDVVSSLSSASGGESPDNGCLIATAAYGSELAPQVQLLREIRDNTVMSTASGASFMSAFNAAYYSFSPAVADLERESPAFREAVKLFITPMLSTLSIMTLAEEGSESQVLGLGISIIALNLGMYVAAPALIVRRLYR